MTMKQVGVSIGPICRTNACAITPTTPTSQKNKTMYLCYSITQFVVTIGSSGSETLSEHTQLVSAQSI